MMAPAHERPTLSERQFMSQVVRYAELLGWRCHHQFDSRRSREGWPRRRYRRVATDALAERMVARAERAVAIMLTVGGRSALGSGPGHGAGYTRDASTGDSTGHADRLPKSG